MSGAMVHDCEVDCLDLSDGEHEFAAGCDIGTVIIRDGGTIHMPPDDAEISIDEFIMYGGTVIMPNGVASIR